MSHECFYFISLSLGSSFIETVENIYYEIWMNGILSIICVCILFLNDDYPPTDNDMKRRISSDNCIHAYITTYNLQLILYVLTDALLL